MASGPPKVPRRAQFDKMWVDGGAAATLLCEAQAYPIPSFRLSGAAGPGPWRVTVEGSLCPPYRAILQPASQGLRATWRHPSEGIWVRIRTPLQRPGLPSPRIQVRQVVMETGGFLARYAVA
ncbi:hypothetical protein E2C01_074123 [Portunus trituberculatus]|uniref:Uncharacterized protein n=1 Tax=Portunus trituberculatus TaxID=210409 RepID=A0A5B7IFH5_PORTR|nr:hypothetical protein [Portunus trituberculatus]